MKKYRIIYADPPWKYRNNKSGGSMLPRDFYYHKMDLKDIKNLGVQNIANKDSVLFLWATVPYLPEALEVLNSWGYKYKTSLFWEKTGLLGMGFWFRGQVEVLLLGVKGKMKAFRIQEKNIIKAKVRKHSQKPSEFRKLIEKIGLTPKIELFARERSKGWDVWGNEVKSDIILENIGDKTII